MSNIHLILGLPFVLVLLVTYSVLAVSSKQMDRARKHYRMQLKFQRNYHIQDLLM